VFERRSSKVLNHDFVKYVLFIFLPLSFKQGHVHVPSLFIKVVHKLNMITFLHLFSALWVYHININNDKHIIFPGGTKVFHMILSDI